MSKPIYIIKKILSDPQDFSSPEIWKDIDPIFINNYSWMENGYTPEVVVKGLYSNDFIYVNYLVHEEKVTIKYTHFNDPVFKDSCVEFFFNPFPEHREEYFNIEFNAIGVIKMGYGIKRNRTYLSESDLSTIKVNTSIKNPIVGIHGSDSWSLICRIPINMIEKISGKTFSGKDAIGNFYKCGDETELKHYGMWSEVKNPFPDFHLPEYFGIIKFSN